MGRAPWVAVLGNLDDGFRHYGPFPSAPEAVAWADEWVAERDVIHVVQLETPTSEDGA